MTETIFAPRLSGQDGSHLILGNLIAGQHPLKLQVFWHIYHQHAINLLMLPRLDQQRGHQHCVR